MHITATNTFKSGTIPLMKNVTNGVSIGFMKNASDDMKQYGNYITEKDNNDAGVAEVIKKFMLEV